MKKIVFLGDSLTYGYGTYPENAYPYTAAQKLNIKSINKGKNGDYTSDMSARFKRDVLTNAPDIVMILGGSNDILNGVPLDHILLYIEEMVTLAQDAGIPAIIGIPMGIDADTLIADGFGHSMVCRLVKKFSDYHDALLQFCKERSLSCVDFYEEYPKRMKAAGCKYLFIDGIHPTAQGYHMMAEIFCEAFQQKNHSIRRPC